MHELTCSVDECLCAFVSLCVSSRKLHSENNSHSRRPLPTLLTFVALPLALGAPVTFARLSRASFMSHLLAPPSCRAFSVVGPLVWNGLPLSLLSLPTLFSQKFLQQLKTTLFGRAGVGSASE